jgi:hypothetical protein
MIDDQDDDDSCALFSSWRITFGEDGFLVVLLGPLLEGINYCSRIFIFYNFPSFFLTMCICIVTFLQANPHHGIDFHYFSITKIQPVS